MLCQKEADYITAEINATSYVLATPIPPHTRAINMARGGVIFPTYVKIYEQAEAPSHGNVCAFTVNIVTLIKR